MKLHLNNNGPPTLSKRLNGVVFQDCAWGPKRRFTHPAFKDFPIISKSGMLSPPSFILPIIVERLILGGLWFHIKLDTDLFTWSTKPVRTLRTEEMKIIFERAKLLIMVIFPKGIKSLEDQTLRHFSRATNFFSKLSFLKLLHLMRFVSHELSWQRGVVFFSELFSLDCWYRVSLALGPGVPPPPQKKDNYRVFVGCSGHRILPATTIMWITDSLSVSFAPHLFLTDPLTLSSAWWLAAVFMPWSTTLMIFSSSEVLEPNVKWDLSLLSACFILLDLMCGLA